MTVNLWIVLINDNDKPVLSMFIHRNSQLNSQQKLNTNMEYSHLYTTVHYK
jgi:hypothetical protein